MTFEETLNNYLAKYKANALHTKRNIRLHDMSAQWALAHAVEEIGEVFVEEVQFRSEGTNRDALVEELGDLFGCLMGYMIRRKITPLEVFTNLQLKWDRILE